MGHDVRVNTENPITPLSDDEVWEKLGSEQFGRLAVAVAGRPDIFPVNYVAHNNTIVFRTAEGSKLASVVINSAVAFEVDGYNPEKNMAWSIVLHGHAALVDHGPAEEELNALPLFPWNVSPKNRLVQITVTQASGRCFEALGRKES
jgi:uncharacterized protein